MEGVMDGWMDGWTDGRMDGWMDGGMDGWMAKKGRKFQLHCADSLTKNITIKKS